MLRVELMGVIDDSLNPALVPVEHAADARYPAHPTRSTHRAGGRHAGR